MVRLDAADLALIEVELCYLPDRKLAEGIQALVDEIRISREEAESASGLLVKAQDEAADGEIALKHMRSHLEDVADVPDPVWKYEDEADDCFDRIRRLGE